MHKHTRSLWRGAGYAFIGGLMIVALFLGFSPVEVSAQAPTATPQDPVWRGFSAARDAIQKERRVDLTLVQSWAFEQADYNPVGIDSCRDLEEGDFGREVYYGWTFNIVSLSGVRYQARVSFDLTAVAVCDRIIEAGATAPVPNPDPNLPAPVAGSAAGGAFELGGHILDMNANTVGLLNRSGMTWVKKQFRMGEDVSGFINAAHANGKKAFLAIVGNVSDIAANYDGFITNYSNYVASVAALGADAIEVHNEPNIDREWPAGQINGATYTRLLASAYNAIKGANPNTLVISGAPAPTGYFGAAGCADGGCNDDVFMQQMAAAGAGNYMDCVGLHYNEGIVSPTTVSGDPRGEYPTYYFGSMLARGYSPFGGKQVCFTELGYLSGHGFSTPIPASFAWANNTTVEQHAAWLAGAATAAAQSGRVRLMIVWNVDFPFYTATDPMGGYAIFRPDGSCPGCDSLGAVMGR